MIKPWQNLKNYSGVNTHEMFCFTGRCLTLTDFPERKPEIARELKKEGFPWEELVWVSSSHLVLPALYAEFRDSGLLSALPRDLSEYMEGHYHRNRERNIRLMEQAMDVAQILTTKNIGTIFLKGMALLLDGTYTDYGKRVIGDIDLLVPPDKLMEAADLLMSKGYIADESVDEVLTHRAHYPSLSHPDKPAAVELHQYPVSWRYKRWFNHEMVADRKIFVQEFPGAFTLLAETNLAVSYMHSEMKDHGRYYALPFLRDMQDVCRIIAAGADPAATPSLRHFSQPFNDYMALCSHVFRMEAFRFENTLSSRWYLFRVKKNFSSSIWYRLNWLLLYPFVQFPRYGRAIYRFLTSPQSRKHLIRKLKDPSWYRSHFSRYKG